ncbi:HipA domain-containing protein [Carboxylicivirga caseinilyticus]|uniref:HipA domain-containing protein n=1 Tax=Carboxylicivirga caseinilyticus TaxID=3417572 RepID=UPI003D329EA8|nr:HipA domain-containing protein [Marinilabiliaceae bacterium A049]
MTKKCLYCYEEVEKGGEFHESCSQLFFGTAKPPVIPYGLDKMAELAKNVVERSVTVPGVQPKLSMSVVEESRDRTDKRLTVVDALGGNYIFKPASLDYPEMPANEHLTMRIAESFGINVVPSSLIRLQSGELSYITKRIDRTEKGERIHMLDMFQITEAFDKYKGSMEKIGKALNEYSANPLLDKLYLFELTLFSFLTGNNDMHLKNFSMVLSNRKWILSPAYDLLNVSIILPEDTEELALTLSGKKKKLTKATFDAFGSDLGLNKKQIQGVYKRFIKNQSTAYKWINKSFLSEEMKKSYRDMLENRYSKLFE